MKIKIAVLFSLFLMLVTVGCGANEKQENGMYVYYLNADGNGLLQREYPQMDLEEVLDKLKTQQVLPK